MWQSKRCARRGGCLTRPAERSSAVCRARKEPVILSAAKDLCNFPALSTQVFRFAQNDKV